MDIDKLRAETRGCAHRIHLNHSGASLMPESVLRTVQDYLVLESEIGGYEAAAEKQEEIQSAYRAVGNLIGAEARNVAFTENATASYIQALSSIPFSAGDCILTTNNDYSSNQIQFLSMQKRLGIEIVRVPDLSTGGVDVTEMENAIRKHRPKLVTVTHVPTNSGLVQDVESIGEICRREDLLYLVDACQSVGQMPVDVGKIGCDFLTLTSRKFLRGPRGAGVLFASDRVLEMGLEPLFIDLKGADWIGENVYQPREDAARFENWEFAYSLVLGTGEAARYAMSVGLENIRQCVVRLAALLRQELAVVPGVRILDRGENKCGIVTAWVEGFEPANIVTELRKKNINTSSQLREDAVIDFDQKQVPGAWRLSTHYFNTEEEINRVVDTIRELVE